MSGAYRVGAVEDHTAQPAAKAGGEGLADVGSITVAVEVDLGDLQRIHHADDVGHGKFRTVQRGFRSELLAAGRNRRGFARIALLHSRAIDGSRGAGATLVDDQDVATVAQGIEDVDVCIACPGRGIARATFLRQDHAEPGKRLIAPRVVLEADGDAAAHGASRVELAPD